MVQVRSVALPIDALSAGLTPARANKSNKKSPASSVDTGTLPQHDRHASHVGTQPVEKSTCSRFLAASHSPAQSTLLTLSLRPCREGNVFGPRQSTMIWTRGLVQTK